MDWLRGLLGGAAGERAPLLPPAAAREASFADLLIRDAHQSPIDTAVVKSGGAAAVQRGVAVEVAATAAGGGGDEVRLLLIPAAPKQQQTPPAKATQGQQQQLQPQHAPAPGGAVGKAGGAAGKSGGGAAARIRAAAYGVTNLSSVVAIVFANKLVLFTHGFHFAATLTWLHCIFTAAGMVGMAAAGIFEVRRVPLARSLPVATVYVGTIVLNNLSIQLNTVGFYQISKIAITPVIVAIEWAAYAKPASGRVLASIAVLLAGIAAATVSDAQVAAAPLGLAVAGANVVVTGLYQVWAGTKQRELGLNGLQLLHQVSPLSVVLLACLIPLLEPVGWRGAGPGTILGYHLTPPAAFWIVVSSALGLVVTLSTFLFIGATSSLTYNVVGHLKTVLIVGGGVVVFGDSMGLKKLAGLACAMAGIVWYSHIKLGEAAKAEGKT
ncbi:slc35e3 [Scenedesmus sp. PABB004]|nr:slc35e3 [Scenedesmus sp. PABB004]